MRNILTVISFLFVFISSDMFAQDSNILKAAEKSYKTGLSEYKKKKYSEASKSLIVVVENIPSDVDSRKYQLMRLEAASKLVEIHFNNDVQIRKACDYLYVFISDLNSMKKRDKLKSNDLYKYLEMEKNYSEYVKTCGGFKTVEIDKQNLEDVFNEEFKE